MDVYRTYRCDFGHKWSVRRSKTQGERPEDTRCPEGHEAITCQVEEPADEVQILIQPAARIVDPVKRQVVEQNKFRLVLLDRTGAELRRSSETYSWDEVIKMSALFRGKTAEHATKWWDRRFP